MAAALLSAFCSSSRVLPVHARTLLIALLAGFSATAIANDSVAEADTVPESVPDTVPDTVPVAIELQFAGEFAGRPFDCATQYDNIGLSQATVGVSDFRLYVSRIRLMDAAGNQTPVVLQEHGPWQFNGVALLDFEDASGACSNGTPETNSVVKLMAPAGEYTGVAFDIGVPFESNHQDPTLAASPLNLTSLFWNWRGGYRFMRVDLQPVGEEKVEADHMSESKKTMHGSGWGIHLGSTGCSALSPTHVPESCESPNRISMEFAAASPQSTTFVIDPARVLTESDVTRNTEGSSPGCMSAPDDPECEAIFKALGLDGTVPDGAASPQLLVTTR